MRSINQRHKPVSPAPSRSRSHGILVKADLEARESAPADYTSKPPREPRVVERATRRILQHALHGKGRQARHGCSTRTQPRGHVVRQLHWPRGAGQIRHQAGCSCHKVQKQPAGADRTTRLRLHPPVCNLGHFHPQAQPAHGPNTRFLPGTLLLFEGTLSFSHNDIPMERPPPSTQHDGVRIAATRGRHGFTLSTEVAPLPEGPGLSTLLSLQKPTLRVIDPEKPGTP